MSGSRLSHGAPGARIVAEVPASTLTVAVALYFGVALLLAVAAPFLFWMLLAATALLGAGLLLYERPVAATAGWLLVVGSTPEFWLGDLVGGGSLLIAAEKLAGLALAAVCAVRYGPRLDLFNPGLAFLAIFACGLQHGLHPRLELAESLRSLAGSAAPFAFSFSRLSRSWAGAVIATVCWLPSLLVLLGSGLAVCGVHPLFVDQLGFRLQATGIPAFLGGFAATGVYASTLELFRGGRGLALGLLICNMAILVLSGARAPLAIGGVLIAGATLCLRSSRFGPTRRLPLALAAAAGMAVLAAVASQLSGVRLFNMLSNEAGSLSGRDLLWPPFQQAWADSPWLGWGAGAAKAVIPPESAIAHLTGTTAPHNEYLRIGVEGGYLGLGLLLVLFVFWTAGHTARLPRTDRVIMRLVMLGIAVHAATDNLLISTTSSVLFAWVSAVFARGALEQGALRRAGPVHPADRVVRAAPGSP
jgi:O-antigen ligase